MDRTSPIVCSCRCGRRYDAHAWKCLPYVGVMDDGVGGAVELRNCTGDGCRSTISIQVPRKPETAREAIMRKFSAAMAATDTLDAKAGHVTASVYAGLFLTQAGGDVGNALSLCPIEPRAIWVAVRALLGLVAVEEPHPLSFVGARR